MWANIEPLMSSLWADSKPLMTRFASDALVNKDKSLCTFLLMFNKHAWTHASSWAVCALSMGECYFHMNSIVQIETHCPLLIGWCLCRYRHSHILVSTHRLVPVQIQTQSHSCFHSQAGACADTDTVTFLFPLTGWCLYRHRHSHDLVSYSQAGADVFNALDIMDNKQVLEELKFGVGDGNLHYYLYNWKCPSMPPNEVHTQL